MQNMIHLPQELYDAIRKKAVAEEKTTEALVIEWVSAQLEEAESSAVNQAFEQEVAAFERMKPDLLMQYAGQYVAIYQGQVVASGGDKLALLEQVREQYGNVVCYVEEVSVDAPRTVRLPSARIIRS